jgi:hypothetical protein
MKITRLKRGYRIRVSDSEFEALVDLTTLGENELDEDGYDDLSTKSKRGMKSITGSGSWATAEDRR